MPSDWDLDRKPTTAERVVGVISALLLCAAGGVSFWFSLTFLKNLWASLLTGGFAVFSAYLLYHFIFTSGRKLHRSEIVGLAVVFTIAGLTALIGSFFAEELRAKVTLLFLGCSGIGGGLLNFSKAKETANQPAQPTDAQIEERMPVWRVLSELFLDTELQNEDLDRIASVLAAAPFSEEKIEEILRFEVTPVCQWNLLSVAGEWAEFNDEWLRRKLAPKIDTRPWLRRAVYGMICGDWKRVRTKLSVLRDEMKTPD